MASAGMGYFDKKGGYHKIPDDATKSDIASILGKVGDGDSMERGIATIILEKRVEIEAVFADHDAMIALIVGQGAS